MRILRKLRIDVAFVVALVRDHLLLNDRVGLRDQRRARSGAASSSASAIDRSRSRLRISATWS